MAAAAAAALAACTLSSAPAARDAVTPGCCSGARPSNVVRPALKPRSPTASSLGFASSSLVASRLPALRREVQAAPATKALVTKAHKGYKLKTHKAAAKRFKVTGGGVIVARRAGRAHLLRKKSTSRKNRLSGKTEVCRRDYNNVIGALPYLKVNRHRSNVNPAMIAE